MKIKCRLFPSFARIFPSGKLQNSRYRNADIAIGEKISFQMAYRTDESSSYDLFKTRVSIEAPGGWKTRIRRPGLVPVPNQNIPFDHDPLHNDCIGKIPGLLYDPLFDSCEDVLKPWNNQLFWFTATPPDDVAPGEYSLAVKLEVYDRDFKKKASRTIKKNLSVAIHGVKLEKRKDFGVTHWFYIDSIIAWYKTNLFEEKFWSLAAEYLKDIANHGQDMIYVPVFTPSLDKDKIPSQLLRVEEKYPGEYSFDWSLVRRFVNEAKKAGIEKFEWCHLASQGGAKCAIRIYEGNGEEEKLLWEDGTPATDGRYERFLGQFLPAFKGFLDSEGLMDRSLFHISDEPHGEEALGAYRAIRAIIKKHAPWFKTFDALSEVEFAREGLVDYPVAILHKALPFLGEAENPWCYYCGGPRERFLNHLSDTPLAKIAMHGFVLYRWQFKGFLHWGYNYWNVFGTRKLSNPFLSLNGMDADGLVPDAGHGDMFLVYPGPDGPVDSIRWELFSEAMDDYRLLQTLGIGRNSPLLEEIKAFDDFPADPAWRTETRLKLLSSL